MVGDIWIFLLVLYAPMIGARYSKSRCTALAEGPRWNKWRPIRIRVEYADLSGFSESQKVTLKNVIVPGAVEYWTKALKVRDLYNEDDKLYIDRDCVVNSQGLCMGPKEETKCWNVKVPREYLEELDVWKCEGSRDCKVIGKHEKGNMGYANADIVIFISSILDKEGGATIGGAIACSADMCGRPNAGFMEFGSSIFKYPTAIGVSVVIHELSHILGFVHKFLEKSIDVNTGKLLYGHNKPVSLWCVESKDTGLVGVRKTPPAILGKGETVGALVFRPGPIKSLNVRGFGAGLTCRCPVDPDKAYSVEDVVACFAESGDCAFGVTTGKVVEAAREYYGCPDLEAMEIENQNGRGKVSGSFIDDHWKMKHLAWDLMVTHRPAGVPSLSKMTLAWFEDLGFYKPDYDMASNAIEGVSWGYKAGCSFVQNACVDAKNNIVKIPYMSKETEFYEPSDVAQCGTLPTSVSFMDGPHPNPSELPKQYNYPGGLSRKDRRFDYCPVRMPYASCIESSKGYNLTRRCITVAFEGVSRGSCARIACASDKSYYQILLDSEKPFICKAELQTIQIDHLEKLVCDDPKLVCAQITMPHVHAFITPIPLLTHKNAHVPSGGIYPPKSSGKEKKSPIPPPTRPEVVVKKSSISAPTPPEVVKDKSLMTTKECMRPIVFSVLPISIILLLIL